MRNVRAKIGVVVALLSAGAACSSSSSTSKPFGPCGGVTSPDVETATSDDACAIVAQQLGYRSPTTFCARCNSLSRCSADSSYESAFRALNPPPDASAPADADADADAGAADAGDGGDAGDASAGGQPTAPLATCPDVPSNQVTFSCSVDCTGRRTAGMPEPEAHGRSVGEWFAACAWLEAVSVVAFARLGAELAAFGAPKELLARVDGARREEERHVALTCALARRFGVEPKLPEAAPGLALAARSLAEVARENAVEGCIRETFGAAIGALFAARAGGDLRAAAEEIAHDEASHAELAWDVHAWLAPRLDARACAEIDAAMRAAARALAYEDAADAGGAALTALGLPSPVERAGLAALLDAHVFRAAA